MYRATYSFTFITRAILSFTLFCTVGTSIPLFAQHSRPKVLIVIAHPDDESGMAATVYKLTHDLHATVDLALITNGEGGYKYSTLAEAVYGLELTKEPVGRKHLPRIRKKELQAAGKIIGIRHYHWFDQKDHRYTQNIHEAFTAIWDTAMIAQRLTRLMQRERFDLVFTLLPLDETHGHHKGATVLALEAASRIDMSRRPIVLGVTVSSKKDTTDVRYSELNGFPRTRITTGVPRFRFDRTQSFGFKNRLTYKVIVNWEIAEHKSQGTMQLFMNEGDFEHFWWYDANDAARFESVKEIFDALAVNRYPDLKYTE